MKRGCWLGVGMLRGRLKGRQAGRFAGCWRGYAQRAMKTQAGREVCRLLAWLWLEGDKKQVVGVGMLRGR